MSAFDKALLEHPQLKEVLRQEVSQTLQTLRKEIEELEDEENPQWDQAMDQALQVIDQYVQKL